MAGRDTSAGTVALIIEVGVCVCAYNTDIGGKWARIDAIARETVVDAR